MINEEGGVDPEQFRMDAMFDRMDAIGKGILGLTIQCAQCHDHKYDPLTQRDYYRLFAFLNNDDEANIAVYTPDEQKQRADVLAPHRRDGRRAEASHARLARSGWPPGKRQAKTGQPDVDGPAAGRGRRIDRRPEIFAAGRRLVPGPRLRPDEAHRADCM